jgi:carboxylesterase type B
LYAFNNIPYAEQPVGNLRFSVPILPTGNSSTINNGSTSVMCMQAASERLLETYAQTYGVSVEVVANVLYAQAGQTEACLALDVYVPEGIFNNRTEATGKG